MSDPQPPADPAPTDPDPGWRPGGELALFVLLSLLAAFAGGCVWHALMDEDFLVNDWSQVQYQMDWAQLGFVKRGLMATLLALGGRPAHPQLVDAAALAVLASIVVVFWTYCCPAWRRARPWPRRLLFALFATSGAMFAHQGFDLGRLDQPSLLVTLLALLAIRGDRLWLAALLAGANVLIHEAVTVLLLPTLAGVAVAQRHPELRAGRWGLWFRRGPMTTLGWFIAPSMLTLALVVFGGQFPGSEQELLAYLHDAGMKDFHKAHRVWLRTPAQSVEMAVGRLYSPRTWVYVGQSGGYLLLFASLSWCLLRDNGRSPAPWLALSLTPVSLIGGGVDFHRWISCAVVTQILMLCAHAGWSERRLDLSAVCGWRGWLLLASAALGPIGVEVAYPARMLLAPLLR